MIETSYNPRQRYAIEAKHKKRLLEVNPKLDNDSGIYFLTRTDEDGISYFYIGQAKHILQRMISHLNGYQHIDLSLKKRDFKHNGINPYGWELNFLKYPENELDKWEQYWILEYTKKGYQCRYNKTAGGQGQGKEKINEFKPSKGYHEGLRQGRKNLARELNHIIEKHLNITLKTNSKISQKQYEKFKMLLDENSYKTDEEN